MLRGLLKQRIHLLVRDLHVVRLSDFREQKAETHAPLGDAPVVVLLVFDFLHRGFGIVGLGRFLLKLRPDLLELGIDHAFGHVEIVSGGQRVEKLALHLGAREAGGFLL